MQKSNIHQLYDLPPFLRSRMHKLRVLETSSTFRLPLLRLGSIRGPEEQRGREIEKGWRERQEAGVINC